MEVKKLPSDPLLYYNLTHQRKVREKLWNKTKELKDSEIQIKSSIDSINESQVKVDQALADILKTLRVILKTTLTHVIEAIKRHNKSLSDVFEKLIESSPAALESISISKDLENVEELYLLERLRNKKGQDELINQEIVIQPSGVLEGVRDNFSYIHRKLLSDPLNVSDQEIHFYGEMLQKRYEISIQIIEERKKMMKGLKAFLQELTSQCENIARQFGKGSKNPLYSYSPMFAFCKRTSGLIEPFFIFLGNLAKKYQNFGTFITMKLAILEGIISDPKGHLKMYQTSLQKIIKEHLNLKTALENSILAQEKAQKKVEEMAEKNDNDSKLPRLKKEMESTVLQYSDCLEEYRNHAIDILIWSIQ